MTQHNIKSIRDLVANDGYAITFQTMGQYRTALLKAIDDVAAASEVARCWQCGHAAHEGSSCVNVAPAARDDDPTTKEQYRRMFQAACSDLGLINEKLRLDPNDGGAEPILAAIDELLATSTPAGRTGLVAAVMEMVAMLDSGEWAEHVAATTGRSNPLAQRLEDAITDLHNEASANRDMLDDARSELATLAGTLGVSYEPHQSLRERLLEAAQRAGAQAVVYPPDGTISPFTVINLGFGQVQMGDCVHDHRLPALWFGKEGRGMGHEEVLNREAKEGETIAVVTFANVDGLDVLLDVLHRIRRMSFPDAMSANKEAQANG